MDRPAGIRVLHVDDEPEFAKLAAELIRRADGTMSVDTAGSGAEGLEAISEVDYDCVVSDYEMPGKDGLAFLEAVREDHPELPFILFTGKGSEEVASDAISAGVTDYLQKQPGTDQYELLVNRIRNSVERQRAHEAARMTQTWASTLLEHASDYLLLVDASATVTYVSPAVERVLGYDPKELIDTDAHAFVHPGDRERAVASFAETLEHPEAEVAVEFRAEAADGEYRWLEVRSRNLLEDPVVEGVLLDVRDITDRKDLEADLEEALDQYQKLVEQNVAGIYIIEDGSIEYVNRKLCEITGYAEDELLGMDPAEIVTEESMGAFREAVRRNLAGEVDEAEYRASIVRADGEERFVDVHGTRIEYHGDPAILGILVDVTEEVELERELEREHERFSALFENSLDPIFYAEYVDGDPIVRAVNGAFEETFGHDAEEAVGRSIVDLVVPGDPDARASAQEHVRHGETGEHVLAQVERETVDGPRTFLIQSTPLEPGKRGARLFGIYNDVTELVEREEELRSLKEEYETVFETAQDALFLFDVERDGGDYEFRLRRLNPAHEAISGLSNEIHRGQTPTEFLDEATGEEVVDNYRRCLEAGEPITYEEVLEMPAGNIHWQTKLAPVTVDGEVVQIVGVARDIGDQKAREATLGRERAHAEERRELLATVSEAIAEAASFEAGLAGILRAICTYTEWQYAEAWLPDERGERLVYCAGAADNVELTRFREVSETTTFRPGEGLIGRVYEGRSPEWIEDVSAAPEGTFVRADVAAEIGVRSALGLPITDGGSVVVVLGFFVQERREQDDQLVTDLTEIADNLGGLVALKRAEERIQTHNRRLEEFASVLSHDLRNPLAVARGRLELGRETGEVEHLEAADRALDRMSSMIDDLLMLARVGADLGDLEPVDLGELIGECWEFVDTGDASLRVDTDLVLTADRSRLRQLLENLMRNAVEHGGPAVGVTIGDLTDGFYVADDGRGIPEDQRDTLLEPRGEDDGFGLAIVRRVAAAHGWDLRITESEDGGARFEFTGVDRGA